MDDPTLTNTLRALIHRLEEDEDPLQGVPLAEAGRLLASLRRRRRLKQWELARLAGTRQSFVSKVERARR